MGCFICFIVLILFLCFALNPIIGILACIVLFFGVIRIKKWSEKEEEKKRISVAAYKKAIGKKIEDYLYKENEQILMDTNIWMLLAEKNPGDFYKILLEKISSNPHQNIFVLNSQINELAKLKRSNDENKRFLARNAFRIIEELQVKDKCRVLTEDAFREVSFSYVDKNIIQITKYLIKKNIKLLIVTNDIPLKIRLRAIIDHANAKNLICVIDDEVLGSKDPLC